MGNKQSSGLYIITTNFNGVKKKYPCKFCNLYEELPQEYKDNFIKTCKEEIKSNYEKNGTLFNFNFFNKHPYEFYIVNGIYYSINNKLIVLDNIQSELKTYCDTLFGPHVPYSINCCRITFINNI